MEPKGPEAPPSPAAPPPDVPLPRRRGGKRKAAAAATDSPFPPPKRLMKERNALHPLPSSTILHNGPVTRARQSPHKIAAASFHTPPPASPLQAAPETPAAYAAGDPALADEEQPVPPEDPLVDPVFDAVRSRGSNVHAVPTSAGWFSWKSIHEIEKHAMPSFFNGKSESRTPDVYMDIRNFIMKKFHLDPQSPVEVKDVEGLSAGDLDARQEVLEFLAHWGLINFHPFLPGEDAANNMLADDGASRASSLLEKLYRFEEVRSSRFVVSQKIELPAPALQPASLNLAFGFAGDLGRPVEPSVEYHCNSCSADCSRKRYHCQKQADFDLCTECYNAGKFGSGMAASDFILMEPADAPGVSCGSWTDQETLLLLEALELFGENWSEIAEHVATKTKDQCMLHFIQMPIEDPFLDVMDEDKIDIQEDKDLTLTKKDSESSNVPEIKETKGADDMDEHISLPIDDSQREVPAEIDDSIKEVPAEIDDSEKVPAEIDDSEKVPAEIDDSKKEVPAEIDDSKIEVPAETGDSCKTGANIVLDILTAAFESIGFLPEQGGIKSFAEAGNPVMALAAFLAGLVEPETVTTSVRSSLKAMSEDSPGIQLATRHCYLLEDPPSDRKDQPEPESMEIGHPSKTEDQMLLSNGTDESKDCVEKNEQNDVQEEKQTEPDDSSQNPPDENKLAESVPPLEATDMNTEVSGDQTLEVKQIMATDNDASVSVLPMMLPSSSVKESADLVLQGEDMTSTATETNNLDVEMEEKSKSSEEIEETSNAAGVMLISAPAEGQEEHQTVGSDAPVKREKTGDDDEITPPKDDEIAPLKDDDNRAPPKDDDNEKDCNSVEANNDNKAPLNDIDEKHCEPVEANTDNTTRTNDIDGKNCNSAETNDDKSAIPIDVDEKIGNPVDEKNGSPVKKAPLSEADRKSSDPVEANDDHGLSKLKQAAVTAISAAAVKAKLLANEEEEQILQLVSAVVENQLRKLEIKLGLFNEMESGIARAREQIDRARQKLLQERQQIVAARLSLSAASLPASKPAASSKPPLGYGPALLRPPSMASLKPPPMKRP